MDFLLLIMGLTPAVVKILFYIVLCGAWFLIFLAYFLNWRDKKRQKQTPHEWREKLWPID